MEGVVAPESSSVGFLCFILVCCAVFAYIFISLFSNKSANDEKDRSGVAASVSSKSASVTKGSKQPQQQQSTALSRAKKPFKAAKQQQFSSPDLQCTFKGHTEPITSGAVSANGKGLVTSSRDRSLFFYNVKEAFGSSGSNSGSVSVQGSRTNIHLDHVEKLCWSPDYAAIVVHKADSQKLEVFKGTKKPDGTLGSLMKVREFPKSFSTRLVGLSVATNGKFILTCDCDNQLSLWDLRGEKLVTLDTRHGNTLSAVLSIDDRFVATTGFTPDVKVWEVVYDKTDNFKTLKKVFELTGHNSRVFSSHFSSDSSKMVTVSKDGTWKLFDTSVEYHQGQDPKLVVTGSVPSARDVSDDQPCVVRLSPDTRVVLVAAGPSVYCYSASSAALVHAVTNIYLGSILDVFFDAGNQFFITLGDLHAHLFHNVAGHHAAIQELEVSLKAASYSGLRERISSQLHTARAALVSLENKTAKKDQHNGKKATAAVDHNTKKKK